MYNRKRRRNLEQLLKTISKVITIIVLLIIAGSIIGVSLYFNLQPDIEDIDPTTQCEVELIEGDKENEELIVKSRSFYPIRVTLNLHTLHPATQTTPSYEDRDTRVLNLDSGESVHISTAQNTLFIAYGFIDIDLLPKPETEIDLTAVAWVIWVLMLIEVIVVGILFAELANDLRAIAYGSFFASIMATGFIMFIIMGCIELFTTAPIYFFVINMHFF